jgi:hypothetical protein
LTNDRIYFHSAIEPVAADQPDDEPLLVSSKLLNP